MMMAGAGAPLVGTFRRKVLEKHQAIFCFFRSRLLRFSENLGFPDRKDRLMVVVTLVFRTIYGDKEGDQILEATATATPQSAPEVHEGYERGGWDVEAMGIG